MNFIGSIRHAYALKIIHCRLICTRLVYSHIIYPQRINQLEIITAGTGTGLVGIYMAPCYIVVGAEIFARPKILNDQITLGTFHFEQEVIVRKTVCLIGDIKVPAVTVNIFAVGRTQIHSLTLCHSRCLHERKVLMIFGCPVIGNNDTFLTFKPSG